MSHRFVLVVALAACGGSPPASPDATSPWPPATVTVHVSMPADTSKPAVGVPIAFDDPDGVLVSTQVTDASGDARATLGAGGSVSLYWHNQGDPTLVNTVTDVQDGDTIDLTPLGRHFGGLQASMKVVVPNAAASDTLAITDSCNGKSTTGATAGWLNVTACAVQPLTVVVTDLPTSGHAITKIAQVDGVALADGGSIQMPPLAAPAPFHVHIDHAPAAGLVTERRSGWFVADGSATPAADGTEDFDVAMVDAAWPWVMRTHGPQGTSGMVLEPIDGKATSYAIDAAQVPTGDLGASVSTDWSVLSLTYSGFDEADLLYLHFAQGPVQFGTVPVDNWYIAAPVGHSLRVPTLPADWDFHANQGFFGAYLVASDDFSDYAAHRGTVGRDLAAIVGTTPGGGRVRMLANTPYDYILP